MKIVMEDEIFPNLLVLYRHRNWNSEFKIRIEKI